MVTAKKWVSELIFSDDIPLEKRKINLFFVCSFIVMFLLFLIRIADRAPFIAIITEGLLVIAGAAMLWLNNRYNMEVLGGWLIMIIAADILFPINFIVLGGVDSGITAWFSLSIIICFLLCKGRSFWILFITHLAVIAACLYFNFKHPELLGDLTNTQRHIEAFTAFLTVGLMCGVAIKFQAMLYERERLKTEEITLALNQAREREFSALKSKTTFLANMSHEMRTPMNAIIGMTTIAEMSDDPAKKDQCLKTIHESADALNHLINDILEMANTDTGREALAIAPFDLRQMFRNATENLYAGAEKKSQSLHLLIGDDIPETVLGDVSKLSSLLTYLISNAIKFTPDGGTISIRAGLHHKDGQLHTLHVDVEDTGIGIAEDQLERIFLPFEQGDNELSRAYSGSGLGLAFSRRIVELMNGHIRVKSTLGSGSTFSFTVELAVPEEKTAQS
jgi:signal transduction histidine kinase